MSLSSIVFRLFGLDPPPPVNSDGDLPPLQMLSPIDSEVIRPASRELESVAPADPVPSSSMDRLPPKVLIKVLEWVALVDRNRNDLLRYRLISTKWKVLLDPLIERKIISGELTPFPKLKDVQIGENNTHPISVPPNRFRDGVNPFPFNSLRVECASKKNPGDVLLSLSEIATSWGGYLTSFSYTHVFLIKELVSVLNCMPNLKRLGLPLVIPLDDIKPTFAFPPPPSLPLLTDLDLESYSCGSEDARDNDSAMVLSIWMIVSYADQLVRLSVLAEYPLPALEQNKEYYHHLDTGARIYIGTTSDSAFGKLSELEISRPNKSFLLHSQTPALRRLSITSSEERRRSRVNFWRVVDFIDKCRQSLQHISLDVTWPELPIGGPNSFIDMDPKELEPSASMIALPLVKTLVLTYAAFYEKVIVNKTLNLSKFPALEELHLIRIHADVLEHEMVEEEVLGCQYEPLVEEIAGYPLIMSRVRSLRGLINGVRTRIQNNREIVEERRRQLVISHERMFEALCQNDEENIDDIGRRLLEREGIWQSCPKLKSVSISLHGRSDGKVWINRRMED